jgi:hypothetical protein
MAASAPGRPRTPPNARPGAHATRRDMGLDMLIMGRGITEVARALGVDDRTVARWRDSPEGARRLAEASAIADEVRKADLKAMVDTAAQAREKLRSIALRAVDVLEEALDDDDVQARLRAVRETLDRAGVPRVERVETIGGEVDYSHMTPEKRALLRELLAEAMGGGSPAE